MTFGGEIFGPLATLTNVDIFGRKKSPTLPPWPESAGPVEAEDCRVAACPSCGVALKKVPGAKTKCQDCGELMYVRTDPRINARVVVTKDQADIIDLAWAVVNGTLDEKVEEMSHHAQVRAALPPQFSEADVQWRMLNEDGLKFSHKGDMYAYQQNVSKMAEHLRECGNLQHALQMYLASAYLVIQGPQSIPEMGRWLPETFIAPIGIEVDYVRSLCERLGMTFEDALENESRVATIEEKTKRPPVRWEEAKIVILDELRAG